MVKLNVTGSRTEGKNFKAANVYIIEHWFVGLSGFSVTSEVTITTGLVVIGFILTCDVLFGSIWKFFCFAWFKFYLMWKFVGRNWIVFIMSRDIRKITIIIKQNSQLSLHYFL
jgi:hypothetical protein